MNLTATAPSKPEREDDFAPYTITDDLNKIALHEPEFAIALAQVVRHFASTYGDKYEAGGSPIVTKDHLYAQDRGKAINLYQCLRYLQRYDTTGFAKSENPADAHKAIHFLMFELVRKNRSIKLAAVKPVFAADATN